MTFEDLRAATARALSDERLRQAELSRRARLQKAEARNGTRGNQERPRPRRA
ncbi:hypothetical protein [Nocardiopsis sp. L17-MgMaSL7]|uniref:hypothetical protein n=1 Tax=Nocardiopsis sp. L17-MgMaSL7 TaxID=1938893 RepID=UPI000D948119|nr:hypothetical protein [Nocardiopsis sp. L17-MgMaSL7]PWV57151.1 hypothetical protein BDW27_10211 [Nocardiopsis sp. L17-MgMaSL7]